MSKTRRYEYWSYMLVLTVFISCRKDLYYEHCKEADLRLETIYSLDWHLSCGENWNEKWPAEWTVDWDRMLPRVPEGVRPHIFDYGDRTPTSSHNFEHHGGHVTINSGHYDMLLYNNGTEGIIFENIHAINETVATTRTRTRSASYSNKYPDELAANVPDMLFAAFLSEQELVKNEDEDEDENEETTYARVKVELVPRTWTYLIRHEFISGREYVSEARAYLSGMAGKVSLKDGHTDNDKVVALSPDCYTCDYGVETITRSFGRSETAATHKPVLELKLMSGKVKMVEFDATDQVSRQPQGGVVIVDGIVATPEEGERPGGSGFDGGVNDWEENVDVDIPIS